MPTIGLAANAGRLDYLRYIAWNRETTPGISILKGTLCNKVMKGNGMMITSHCMSYFIMVEDLDFMINKLLR